MNRLESSILRRSGFVVLFVVCALSAFGAPISKGPDSAFARIENSFKQINDYRAEVQMTIKGPQISINNMPMTIYYKKPNKFKLDSREGVAIAPQGMFSEAPGSRFNKGPKPVYIRTEKRKGVDCWLYKSADNQHMGAEVYIWVDVKRVVVTAMEVRGQMKVKSEWEYVKMGGIYLPSKIKAEMPTPVVNRNPRKQASPPTMGTTTVTVIIKNYRVNKGIPDSVFVEKKTKK